MTSKSISAARLRELLNYDPATGVFTNLIHRSSSAAVGRSSAGFLKDSGYRRITLGGTSYYAHRLAWAHAYGAWPSREIDHINGDRSDNRLANLREATRSLNAQNKRAARRDSAAGLLGAHKNGSRWRAQITVDGKCVNLGYFDTAEEAHAAYLEAKRRMHSGCTI